MTRWVAALAAVLVLSSCSSGTSARPAPSTSVSTPAADIPEPTATVATDARFRADREALAVATVELVHRPSTFAPWRQECTGTKVRVAGQVYVLTARHCIADRIDRKSVFPSLGTTAESMTAPDLHRPVDVTAHLQEQLGVRAVRADGSVATDAARVTRAAVQWYPDVALLSVARSPGYDAVPALRYVPDVELGLEGGEVATSGIPAAAARRLQQHGTYLGRVQNPSDPTQLLDLVGLHPSGPAEDSCNYGASGSLAVIAPGSFTGPLALRNNVVNKAGSNGEDDPRFDRRTRKEMAEQLDRSLAGYATICGYAELTAEVLRGLRSQFR